MTNPVILYGTQSNGETLPVQVDATGRLVAEGLPGGPGEQGPQGDKGDKGDPGEPGEGVPKPYGAEGDVLTIYQGVPSWREPPASASVPDWAFMLDASSGWKNDNYGYRYSAFDGNPYTSAIVKEADKDFLLTIPFDVQILLFEVQMGKGNTNPYKYRLGDIAGEGNFTGDYQDWIPFTRLTGAQVRRGDIIKFKDTKDQSYLRGVRLNGELLLDPSAVAMNACIPAYQQTYRAV